MVLSLIASILLQAAIADTTTVKQDTLDAARIVTTVQVLQAKGDTLVYNIAATQSVSYEDMLIDVLCNLPGIEAGETGVKVMGKNIEKVFINGRLIFGDDPSAALNYLAGQQVINVKVWERLRPEDRMMGNLNAPKQTVMDVKTKDELTFVTVAQALASGGHSLSSVGDETDLRFHLGGGGNFFSEMNLVSANAYIGNTGRDQNVLASSTDVSRIQDRYSQLSYIGIAGVKKFSDPDYCDVLSASYSYGTNQTKDSRSLTRTYDSEDELIQREFFSMTKTEKDSRRHNFSASYKSVLPYVPAIEFNISALKDTSCSLSRMELTQQTISSTDNTITSRNDNVSAGLKLYKGVRVGNNANVTLEAGGDWRRSNGDEFQTISQGATTRQFISDPVGQGYSAYASSSLSWSPFEHRRVAANYKIALDDSKRKLLRYENAVSEANLDHLLSEDYTLSSLKHKAEVTYGVPFGTGLTFGVNMEAASLLESRTLPVDDQIPNRTFLNIGPTIKYDWTPSPAKMIGFQLYTVQTIPSTEQLSSRIDNSNPLYIRRGNPNLHQSRQVLAFANMVLGGQTTYSSTVKATASLGDILPSATYVDGITTTSWVNADRANINVDASFDVQSYIRRFKGSLKSTIGYNYANSPVYTYGNSSTTVSHNPYIKASLKSKLSRKHSLGISANINSNYSNNSNFGQICWVDDYATISLNSNISKRLFSKLFYSHRDRFALLGSSTNLHSNTLNALFGVKLPYDIELSAACYDILNDTPVFRTIIAQDYVQTTISPSYGRIWLVNLVWRFNSSQKPGSKRVDFGRETLDFERNYEENHYKVMY